MAPRKSLGGDFALRSRWRGRRSSWSPHRSEVSSVPSSRLFRIEPSSAASSAEPRCRGRGISTLKSCGDAAVLDDQHAIGQRDGFGDVVRHQDRGKALIVPDPLQQPLHRNPRQRIERAERLVERQHARMADQRARQRHALLLSAGQHRRPLRRACRRGRLRPARSRRGPARPASCARGRGRPRHSTAPAPRAAAAAPGTSRGRLPGARPRRS